ncbi:MAG TPA: hypothetical protein VGV37_19845 [Aliidongia sp.]|uniref:hypothetical protein n=1 Tax=Aliidongia sp. TaxID=1914230 RepID=UPI002DDD5303|nr:hypothetical protein [Aliidongia sp.]HEV2676789.1 hypothetical protein [Aliidongia sp.]
MNLSKLASLSFVGLFLAGPSLADELVTAVLPTSRSAVLGQGVTVFATVINSAGAKLTGCSVASSQDDTSQTSIAYALTDPATNAVTSGSNPGFDLAKGASQTMVLTIVGNTSETFAQVQPVVQCSKGGTTVSSTPIDGLNTILFSADTQAGPDVIALVATPSGDGVLRIQGNGAAAFAVAVSNVGAAADTIWARVDTGGSALPMTASICQTGTDGQCLAAAGSTATLSLAENATATFAVFVQANGQLPFAPANARVYVSFDDVLTVRGETSVAVTNGATLDPTLPKGGIYQVAFPVELTDGLENENLGTLFLTEDGEFQGVEGHGRVVSGTLATANSLIQTGTATYHLQGSNLVASEAWTGAISQRSWFSADLVNSSTSANRVGPGAFSVSGTYEASTFERASSLVNFTGAWKTGDGFATPIGNVNFATDGSFSGTISGCVVAGSTSLIDTRYNLYRMTMSQASCPGASLAVQNFTGLAAFVGNQTTSDTLLFIGNDATQGAATSVRFSRD